MSLQAVTSVTTTPDPRIRRHAARISYYRHAVIQTSLAHPTEELAAALGGANLAHRDALTQLLVGSTPRPIGAIRPADRVGLGNSMQLS